MDSEQGVHLTGPLYGFPRHRVPWPGRQVHAVDYEAAAWSSEGFDRMELFEALNQLREWCDQSAGQPIPLLPERTAVFESRSVHADEEIREVEERLACSLPASYHRFMAMIGASSLFSWSPYGGGPRFYRPDEVIEASLDAAVTTADGDEHRFCFVGEHRAMGDFMGFLISRPAPKNFDVFCHEYQIDEYVAVSDEIKSWRTFEGWLIHAVETRGEETI